MKMVFEKLNNYFYGKFQLAVLDLHSGRWNVTSETKNIPYLKAENASGRHILLKPFASISPYYMLIDDLTSEVIRRHHQYPDGRWKPGRMVVETSPENYQVWIHSTRYLILDEKRYWLEKLRNDPGADPNNRWGRCPGFRNRKEKYRNSTGGYPLAKLGWIDWKHQAEIPQFNLKFFDQEPSHLSPQSRGGVCQSKNLSRMDYDRGDDSSTDFAYALALVRRNYQDEEIKFRIIEERTNWKNHNGERRMHNYLNRTISKARRIVESDVINRKGYFSPQPRGGSVS